MLFSCECYGSVNFELGLYFGEKCPVIAVEYEQVFGSQVYRGNRNHPVTDHC